MPLHLDTIEALILVAPSFLEDIPTKIISITPLKDFEGTFGELNFRKKKVMLYCSYNPHKNLIANHLNILGKILDTQIEIYDNFLIVGDFNSEMTESAMENFCGTYHLHNLIMFYMF